MQEQKPNILVTPFFKVIAVQDMIATKKAGRPIFNDQEFVEVRIAGDRNFAPCYPAHIMWKKVDGEEVTYAMRWNEQYRRFKENDVQVAYGTPLEEAPFLTMAKRYELKALKIYTVDALAILEGKALKMLGMEGNKLKAQAKAYLEKADAGAGTNQLLDRIATLEAALSKFAGAQVPVEPEDASVTTSSVATEEPETDDVATPERDPDNSFFASWSEQEMKDFIKRETGRAPTGTPHKATLQRMCEEIEAEKAEVE